MVAITKCQLGVLGGTGAFLTLIGAIFLGAWHDLFDFILYKQLILSENSYSNELWETTPIPIYIDFHFFNWENPEDIYNPDPAIRKPRLTEMGPYVFKESRRKVVLGWNDQNNTVTFLQNRTWHFEPSLSKGSLDDLVTTINIPAAAAAFTIREYPDWVKAALNFAFGFLGTPLHVTKKVGEFIFDGYSDPLLYLYELLPEGFLPVIIPFDKFGWFYTRNGSAEYDGVFNMFTGKSNISRFGKVARWNYENPVSFYKSHCGVLNGSAGEFFEPHPKKGGSISLFSSDICRMLTLNYKEEVKVEGIKGYRYWGDRHTFENISVNPETWCYCPSGPCAPHGAIDVSPCKWGAPAYISFPHFFNADPSYHEAIDGMTPNEENHQLFIDLEKHTGIPLQVAASLQINILMEPRPEYKIFQNLPKIYFPTMWFKMRARIDDEIGPQVRLVSRIPAGGYVIFTGMLCMGLFILIIVGSYYYLSFRKQNRSETDLKLVGT